MKTIEREITKLLKRMPQFMHPELDGVETLADLDYRVRVEIDLGESGSTEPRWTKAQLHKAKMFFANVHLKSQEYENHPYLYDSCNYSGQGADRAR